MKDSKYIFTGKTKIIDGKKHHQIKAVSGIPEIGLRKNQIGGWLMSEKNLSQSGNCWAFKDAVISDNAIVKDGARVHAFAMISGNAMICDDSVIYSNARVMDNAVVKVNSVVYEYAKIFGKAVISGGEDGPYILANSFIDFDVHYGEDYLQICLPYDFLVFCISQSGKTCVSDDFSGQLEDFIKHLNSKYSYLKEKKIIINAAKDFIQSKNL